MKEAINGKLHLQRMFTKLKQLLNKPYPGPESLKKELLGFLYAGIIVFLVLYLFRPFGLGSYKGSIMLYCLQFGMVTAISGFVYTSITYKLIGIRKDDDNWLLKYWILDILAVLVLIALANYFFLIIKEGYSFSIKGLSMMLFNTVVVGIIPSIIFGFSNQLRYERKHRELASNMDTAAHDNKVNESVEIILAAEAMQNYINIYRIKNGHFSKNTLRTTLSQFLEQTPELSKCHRSYLVNLKMVESVSGNAQGLKLKLLNAECLEIPVSRSYVKDIRQLLG